MWAADGEPGTLFGALGRVTDHAAFVLAVGEYRFRADVDGTQFWTGEANHCAIPGCTSLIVTIPQPVQALVQDTDGVAKADLPVYVFDGTTYTGFHGVTDEAGTATFRLREGDYRFRVDLNGTQFWSGATDHCSVPGCLSATVELPGWGREVSVTIDYSYDPLCRLTAADYSTGGYFHYTYDAVGNRLTQETEAGNNAYTYDVANPVSLRSRGERPADRGGWCALHVVRQREPARRRRQHLHLRSCQPVDDGV